MSNLVLFDRDFDAGHTAAGEGADFARCHFDNTVFGGVDGEIAAGEGTFATALATADLADNNLAGFDLLATEQLNAQALTD